MGAGSRGGFGRGVAGAVLPSARLFDLKLMKEHHVEKNPNILGFEVLEEGS